MRTQFEILIYQGAVWHGDHVTYLVAQELFHLMSELQHGLAVRVSGAQLSRVIPVAGLRVPQSVHCSPRRRACRAAVNVVTPHHT